MTEADTSVRRSSAPRWLGAAALVVATVVAFLVYRPDRQLPFDILDFSEFLPILQASESYWERTRLLADYYAGHGRANILPYALLSAKWGLFGWWSPGWQWPRFVVMMVVLVLCFILLRRLGATTLAAVAGASVFLVAPSAVQGWIRLTMGEPLGTLMLLALCLTILPSKRLRNNPVRWIAAGVMVAGILWTKEMFAATLVLPLALVAITDDEGRVATPRASPPLRLFLLLLSVVGLLCLGPMIAVLLSAPAAGFASQFGAESRSVGDTIAAWLATIIPVDPVYAFPQVLMGLVLLLILALLVGGWWLHLRTVRSARSGYNALLVFAVFFPLLGAAIYIPWKAYQQFYAIPFVLGTSILVAFALTGFERRAPRLLAITAYGWWMLLLLVGTADAQRSAGRAGALRELNYRLVERISEVRGIDSVFVPSGNVFTQTWQGLGVTLGRYAAAVHKPWPPSADVPCTGSDVARGRTVNVIAYYYHLCPHPSDESPIVEAYRRFSLRRLDFISDSLRIDVAIVDKPSALR